MLNAFPTTLVVFYAFAALLIASAFMVILSRHPVQSALYLVLAFFASAALWIMMQAEFLGLILILVYVGAVMTLFLFVVMTIPMHTIPIDKTRLLYIGYGSLVLVLFLGVMAKIIHPLNHIVFQLNNFQAPGISGATAIGESLYTTYVFPFEIAGFLLLVAIIAAISLSWKTDRRKIINDVSAQVNVKAKDRLKIVKMKAEKPQQDSTEPVQHD
ncbi:MAG: nuoJ [Gammaproteobacteria bacterium]|jgi:NADH-quinone oxidoreductase subunit J|nr:nuoJ [Gammaproteobacteria bacterium]